MKVLVTGITGYMGSLMAERMVREGHEVRGFARHPERATRAVRVIKGDALTGEGLDVALADIDVAYFLIHSMEPAADDRFAARERTSAETFARAAAGAGVSASSTWADWYRKAGHGSAHLRSRMAVEHILRDAVPESVALRASIVIGARSRSFRFLVRLVERLPVLAVPAWRQPPDGNRRRARCRRHARPGGRQCRGRGPTLDVGGPDVVSYGELIDRIADLCSSTGPRSRFKRLTVTPIASRISAVIAGEDHELIGPLMESLDSDLLLATIGRRDLLGVRLHPLDAAIEHALAEWEATNRWRPGDVSSSLIRVDRRCIRADRRALRRVASSLSVCTMSTVSTQNRDRCADRARLGDGHGSQSPWRLGDDPQGGLQRLRQAAPPGRTMDQAMHVRGVTFQVHWTSYRG